MSTDLFVRLNYTFLVKLTFYFVESTILHILFFLTYIQFSLETIRRKPPFLLLHMPSLRAVMSQYSVSSPITEGHHYGQNFSLECWIWCPLFLFIPLWYYFFLLLNGSFPSTCEHDEIFSVLGKHPFSSLYTPLQLSLHFPASLSSKISCKTCLCYLSSHP